MTAGAAELARVAALLADDTRATFCLTLLDGRAWTATELAKRAGVAVSTASEHLSKLVGGGLLTEWRQGRHRYVSLAGPEVAELIEHLSSRLPPAPVTSLKASVAAQAMTRGRTCYDHLAGRLGVAVTDALTGAGYLRQETGFALTGEGLEWLASQLAITDLPVGPSRRPLVRGCLDWTERRPHLAGTVGARICERFFDREWVVRVGSSRAVRLTPAGAAALREQFHVDTTPLLTG
jgi:DNA-binding transcriptional ArsR family regulator